MLSVHFCTLAMTEIVADLTWSPFATSLVLPDSLRRREAALPGKRIARVFQNKLPDDMNRAPCRQSAAAQQGDDEQNHLAGSETFHPGQLHRRLTCNWFVLCFNEMTSRGPLQIWRS